MKLARRGVARRGKACRGSAGQGRVRQGRVWLGRAWQGEARQGRVWYGLLHDQNPCHRAGGAGASRVGGGAGAGGPRPRHRRRHAGRRPRSRSPVGHRCGRTRRARRTRGHRRTAPAGQGPACHLRARTPPARPLRPHGGPVRHPRHARPGLRDGDTIMVNRRLRAGPDGIYVLDWDGVTMVKRVRRTGGSGATLISTNPAYPPLDVELSDRPPGVVIRGRVVWIGRTL